MDKRSLIPLSLLSLLVVLAVGASVLALSEAPGSTDVLVRNAVNETLAAPSFRAITTTQATLNGQSQTQIEHISYTSPSQVVVVVSTTASSHGVRVVLTHSQETAFLANFEKLTTTKGWATHGSYYGLVRPASSLVPPSAAKLVSGTVVTQLYVTNGYLTSIVERIHVTEGGQTSNQFGRFTFVEIGGHRISSL